jgi:hypothetical protein
MLFPLADTSSGSIVVWALVLVALLVVGWIVVAYVRKWMLAPDETGGSGFTLSDLRRMHKGGRMTDEEFEKAKALIVGAAKAQGAKPPASAADENQPRRRYGT